MIRFQLRTGNYFHGIAAQFRIYGSVKLEIEGASIKCLNKADDFMANGIYYGTDYEADEFRLVKILTASSNFFVEVGSYTGIFSMFVAKNNPRINVVCVEPHPNNYARILENINLNKLSNIQVEHVAAGDEAQPIKLSIPSVEFLSAVGSVNHTFSQAFHGTLHKEVEVEQVTLDSILNEKAVGPCDLIKIDVEYYELNVLKGARKTLESAKPLLMVEIILSERLLYYKPEMTGKINALHAQEVESFLREYGYSPYHILKDGIYRVDSIINSPDTRNFLFARKATSQRFVPFEQMVQYFLTQ